MIPPIIPPTSNKRPDPKYALLFSCLQITLLARKIFQLFLVGIALVYLSDRGIERAQRFCFFNLTVFFQFFFPQHSAGTAALLQQMENFSGNLASSLPYLKRKSHRARRDTDKVILPYTILTPNIGKEHVDK